MKVKIKTKYLWTTGESADVSFNTINVSGHTDYETVAEPTAPPSGKLRVFADSSDNKLKVKKPNGVVVDLESGAGGGSSQHNLLDSSVHPDTAATSVQRGMLIVGRLISGVIKWAGLVLGVAGKVLKSNGTDVVWGDVEWNEIANKPATFPPSSHTHPLSEIQQSGAQTNQVVKWSGSAWQPGNVNWNEVTDKPTTFPPSSHTHPLSEISQSGAQTNQVPKWSGSSWVAGNVDWNEVTNKPSTFPPSTHASSHERGGSDVIRASRLHSGLDADKPTTGNVEGDVWWATDTDKLYVWDGSAWKEIGGGSGGSSSHNLLDGSVHLDTVSTTVQRGMLVVGQLISGVIKWAGLALGSAGKVLKSNGTDAIWDNVDWTEITNKPTTFPPSSHTHTPSDISPQGHNSGLNADLLDGQHATAFAAAVHTHVKSDITDFAHASSHQHGGSDEIATATPAANAIPKAGSDGKLATGWLSDNLRTVSVGITVGDGVNPITTGVKGAIWIPISGTIVEWTILSTDGATPTTGSIEFDILKSTYSNYPTMTSIVGSGTKPNITNSNKGNGTPSGWSTTQINAGDCLRFDVTSVTSLKRVTLVLKVVKS